MFEKFTEKAINVVTEAQNTAIAQHSVCVLPEHLLLALVKDAKGISLKIFKSYNINFEELEKELFKEIKVETTDRELPALAFSNDLKVLLRQTLDLATKSGNATVLYEHLFLAVINDKYSNNYKTLERLGFDIQASKQLL